KKRSLQIRDSTESSYKPQDSINISVEARKKQLLNQISNDMISQVTQKSSGKEADDNLSKDIPLMSSSGERIIYEN
ncbi:hypothetical protein ACFLZT_05135, partial [Thermodesulfobacteriota bacterium]